MNTFKTTVVGLVACALAPVASAAVSDAEFKAMQRKLDQALDRISELEGQRPAGQNSATVAQVEVNAAKLEKADWASKIQFNGDLRQRYETIDNEGDDGKRKRNRLRARFGFTAQPADELEIGVRLATGSDDPVSTNQTLGGFGSSKGINLDRAYFKWQASEAIDIGGGKFENNITTPGGSELQWDGDWSPEGLNANFVQDGFFARGMATWLEGEEDKRDNMNVDEYVLGLVLQTGIETELAGADVVAGFGYTTIDTKGKPCFDGCGQNASMGGVYMYDFNVFDAFVEASVDAGGRPLKFWGQYINNSDAGTEDSGHQIGVQYGKAKKQGTWQGKLFYQELDADATLSALANSDIAGGGTDNKGIFLSGAYALTDYASLAFGYYMAERKNDATTGIAQDRDTLQLDLKFKY